MPASEILGVWRTAFTVNQRASNKSDSQAKQHQKKVIHLLLFIVKKNRNCEAVFVHESHFKSGSRNYLRSLGRQTMLHFDKQPTVIAFKQLRQSFPTARVATSC